MNDFKRRSANAIPLQRGSAAPSNPASKKPQKPAESLHGVKLEVERLREKLQKSVIDNPQTAKKAALLISLWIEGKARRQKKAG